MKLILLIGPPDASLDAAAAAIGAHSSVASLPPGRLLTALAHVGIEANIDKAAYDHILAGPSQRQFLERIEGGLAVWPLACRAYLDALVEAASRSSDAPYLLDTAPEYARLWPFIERVLPAFDPVVLVRNPVATAAQVLGDDSDTRAGRRLLLSWRHIAGLLRARGDECVVLRYENLLRAPAAELGVLADRIGGHWQAGAVDQATMDAARTAEDHWPRDHWPQDLAGDPARLARVRALLERVSKADLDTLGYPWDAAWAPVAKALGREIAPRPIRCQWHAAKRMLTGRVAAFVAVRPAVASKVRRLKLACDVLLRE